MNLITFYHTLEKSFKTHVDKSFVDYWYQPNDGNLVDRITPSRNWSLP